MKIRIPSHKSYTLQGIILKTLIIVKKNEIAIDRIQSILHHTCKCKIMFASTSININLGPYT